MAHRESRWDRGLACHGFGDGGDIVETMFVGRRGKIPFEGTRAFSPIIGLSDATSREYPDGSADKKQDADHRDIRANR